MKPESTNIINRIGSRRWEALLLLFIVVLIILGRYGAYPAGVMLWKDAVAVRRDAAFVSKAGTITAQVAAANEDAAALRTVLSGLRNRQEFNEATVLERVYRLADTAGCSVGKVEIGAALDIEGGREIPITFTGSGSYTAIGYFIDGIENMAYATRVRSLNMKKTATGTTVFADFVVLDE